MNRLLRVTLFLVACALLAPFGNAHAQALQWIDLDHVVVCPARAGDAAPPDFAGADCRRTAFWAVDSQQAALWLKASITMPPAMLSRPEPLGLFVSGKAASTAWVNGRLVGSNGRPGGDAGSEAPGRMDAVIPIPPGLLKPGANEIVLQLSGHHGFLHLAAPMHLLAVGVYGDPADVVLRSYWPSLITFGVFVLGVLSFGVSALRGRDRIGSLLLCLTSLFAAGQLLAEVSRGLFPYSYPMHDLRLAMIAVCSLGFGLCLTAQVIRRFKPPHPALTFIAIAVVTTATAAVIDGYDTKATVAMLFPVIFCALGTAYWSWRRRPDALAFFISLVLFGALSVLFGGAFLNAMFFYLVAALLLFLFAQQASALAREQQLRVALSSRAQQLEAALDQAQAQSQPPAQAQKLKIIDSGKIELVPTDQITHCSGAGDYVELHFADGRTRLHSGSLNDLEAELPPAFVRVHRSHIVNMAFVQSLEREASGVGRLFITTGKFVPVSRRIMPMVRRAIGADEMLAS